MVHYTLASEFNGLAGLEIIEMCKDILNNGCDI